MEHGRLFQLVVKDFMEQDTINYYDTIRSEDIVAAFLCLTFSSGEVEAVLGSERGSARELSCSDTSSDPVAARLRCSSLSTASKWCVWTLIHS